MNLDFSDEQKMLQDQASKFLADRCSLANVRKILEGDEPYDLELWSGVAEMGWTGAAIPEAFGGIGFGHLELCVIAEELGRANAPIPFSSSVYLATEAILLAGSQEQKETYLPKLAAGELIGTLTVAEGAQAPRASTLGVTYNNGRLNGTKLPVADGDVADFAVVVANPPTVRSWRSPT
jgi:acyl-CoA dehydrogenase